MFCPQCGSENKAQAKFCKSCGKALPQKKIQTPEQRARVSAEETDHKETSQIKINNSSDSSKSPSSPSPETQTSLQNWTFKKLIKHILSQTIKSLIKSIPMTIGLFIVGIIFQIFLPVNQGIMGKFRGSMAGSIFWMLISGSFFMFLGSFKTKGFGKTIGDIFRIPVDIIRYCGTTGWFSLIIILSGAGVALMTGSFVQGSTCVLAAFGGLMAFSSNFGRGVAILIQTTWGTVNQVYGKNQSSSQMNYGLAASYVVMFGSLLGFLLGSSMGNSSWGKLFLGIVLLVISVPFIFGKKSTPVTRTLGLVIGGCAIYDLLDVFVAEALQLGEINERIKTKPICERGVTDCELPSTNNYTVPVSDNPFPNAKNLNFDDQPVNTNFGDTDDTYSTFDGWSRDRYGLPICCNAQGCENPSSGPYMECGASTTIPGQISAGGWKTLMHSGERVCCYPQGCLLPPGNYDPACHSDGGSSFFSGGGDGIFSVPTSGEEAMERTKYNAPSAGGIAAGPAVGSVISALGNSFSGGMTGGQTPSNSQDDSGNDEESENDNLPPVTPVELYHYNRLKALVNKIKQIKDPKLRNYLLRNVKKEAQPDDRNVPQGNIDDIIKKVNGSVEKYKTHKNEVRKDEFHKAINKLKNLDVDMETKNKLIKSVKKSANLDDDLVPHGNVAQINKMLDAQIRASKDKPKGYWSDVANNFTENVKKDVESLPESMANGAKIVAEGTKKVASVVYKEATDLDNYKALGQAYLDTAKDMIGSPIESTKKVGNFYRAGAEKAGDIAGTLVATVEDDPAKLLEIGKAMVGADIWEKVIDPNLSLGERLANVGYGTLDAGMNLMGGGAAKVTAKFDKMKDMLRLGDKVDDMHDTTKAAKAIDKVEDVSDAAKASKVDGAVPIDPKKPPRSKEEIRKAIDDARVHDSKFKDGEIDEWTKASKVSDLQSDMKLKSYKHHLDEKWSLERQIERARENGDSYEVADLTRKLEKNEDMLDRAHKTLQGDSMAKQKLNRHEVIQDMDGKPVLKDGKEQRFFDHDESIRKDFNDRMDKVYNDVDPEFKETFRNRVKNDPPEKFRENFGVDQDEILSPEQLKTELAKLKENDPDAFKKLNFDPEKASDLEIKTLSGKKDYVKVHADRDAAMNVIIKDKHTGELKQIELVDRKGTLQKDYNEIYYKKSGGDKHFDLKSDNPNMDGDTLRKRVDDYGSNHEQKIISRKDAEGFEGGKSVIEGDIKNVPDVENVKHTMNKKSNDLHNKFDEMMEQKRYGEAGAAKQEALRMTNKEAEIVQKHIDNFAEGDVGKKFAELGKPLPKLPPKIEEGLEIMKKLDRDLKPNGKPYTFLEVEKELRDIGLTSRDVTRHVSETFEEVYKLAPPEVKKLLKP